MKKIKKHLDCETVVRKLVKDYLEIDNFSIERCHHIGPKLKPIAGSGSKRSRPIIVKFTFYKERNLVWKKRLKWKLDNP